MQNRLMHCPLPSFRGAEVRHQRNVCMPGTSGCLCVSVSAACRAGKVEEAVVFAQTSLAPLRGLMTSRMGVSDTMLREVVALLAYEDPMVSTATWAPADEHGNLWVRAGMP